MRTYDSWSGGALAFETCRACKPVVTIPRPNWRAQGSMGFDFMPAEPPAKAACQTCGGTTAVHVHAADLKCHACVLGSLEVTESGNVGPDGTVCLTYGDH